MLDGARYATAMTHAYRQLIAVDASPETQLPEAFTWREERYEVLEVWTHWRLESRWWEEDTGGPFKGHTDRRYYRVRAQVHGRRYDMLAEIYQNAAQPTFRSCW
jgi:hypothetical protein